MTVSYSTGVNRPQASLALAPVAGPLDPGDDRDPQLLSSAPGAAVEDVLLQQCEEALHGGVVASGPDAAHRADQTLPSEYGGNLP
jgi:hypothetical protein